VLQNTSSRLLRTEPFQAELWASEFDRKTKYVAVDLAAQLLLTKEKPLLEREVRRVNST
jgi:hypothetical protein